MTVRQLIVRKLLLLIPGLLFVATIVFLAMRVLPGDATSVVLGDDANPEAIANLKERLGLNEPLIVQYGTFLKELATGDLGTSLVSRQPVTSILGSVFPHTLLLALGSMVVGVVVGVPAGILAASRSGGVDTAVRLGGALLYSVPVFYSGIVMLIVFSIKLGWFPVLGAGELSDPLDYLWHLALPAISLGMVMAALVMRVTRSAVGETLGEEYIRSAQARGFSSRRVLYRHALRNALVPIVTVVALYLTFLLNGAVLTETVFNRPGIGKVLIGAVQNRDYVVIQSTLVVFAAIVMMLNLFTDLLYRVVNPRLRTT